MIFGFRRLVFWLARILVLACVIYWPRLNYAAAMVVKVDDRTGMPVVLHGGGVAMSSSFVFWGKNWKWAETRTEFKFNSPREYSLAGRNSALNFDIATDIRVAGKSAIVWEFALDSHVLATDVIGGGLVFKFDLNRASDIGAPVLLPENRGWSWRNNDGSRIEMRFDPPLEKIAFEPNNAAELRAFFYKNVIPQGKKRYTATMTIGGDVVIGPTDTERYGGSHYESWPSDNLSWKLSPVDLSFLNSEEKPAGKRGFVKADGDKLVFGDNTQARFWGTNISAYSIFGTPKDAVQHQARRLSSLGFNLVRIHHHDSDWVSPNIFGNSKFVRDTQNISADAIDKIDWWIKCLKEEGIYVWLDIHVQRGLTDRDSIYAFDEIFAGKRSAQLKGFSYVNITIQSAMKRFAEAYMTHSNPYTGLKYKDDPAIAAVLITNENDLTHHFGNALLPDKNVPGHNKIYMNLASVFAENYGLSKDKTWRSWEHGPSKLFLNDLEHRFNVEMIQHLRGLGVKVPIATTNMWGYNPLSSLPALTAGDVIDVHSYAGAYQLEKNPMVSAGLIQWIAAAQVIRRPLTVSEWNAGAFPLNERHSLPLLISSSARLHGWDALMQFAYSQEPLIGGGNASNWHAYNDPSLLAMLPAAALLYRRGDVKEATSVYVFDAGQEAFFNQPISPSNSVALRTAAEKGKLLIALPQRQELPWLKRDAIPAGAIVIRDPNQSILAKGTTEVVSDTGEVKRDWERGIYTVNTQLTQAVAGWIGGQTIALEDTEFKLATRNASVAVQSLDNAPVKTSKDILVSIGTRSIPRPGNKTPFFIEPIKGEIRIRARNGLRAIRYGRFSEQVEVPVKYDTGVYTVRLDGIQAVNWIYLRQDR